MGRQPEEWEKDETLGFELILEKFAKEAKSYPEFTPAEESDLVHRKIHGDEQALLALVNANLRHVIQACREFRNRGIPMVELLNAGNLGLITAAKEIKEIYSFRFIDHALLWIRREIKLFIIKNRKMRKKSRNIKSDLHRSNEAGSSIEITVWTKPQQPVMETAEKCSEVKTILVVDDSYQILKLVTHVLRSKGFEILQATDAEIAMGISASHEGNIDLLISDIELPLMKGDQLARSLKIDRPGLMVLLMSGYFSKRLDEINREVQVLPKPFKPADLINSVESILGLAAK